MKTFNVFYNATIYKLPANTQCVQIVVLSTSTNGFALISVN